ncbi:hypothetical protein ACQ5SO_08145 [Rhodovulum sp. DZ06]|uniref:hypothetical protein n=1 Tax=Rhodovulum sp. DZ06 TaxID=3425126 RepID=UPI003D34C92F
MARITSFHEGQHNPNARPHTETECSFSFVEVHGEPMVNLATFGSKDRQKKGSTSQTIQLDREAALALVEILRRQFDDI